MGISGNTNHRKRLNPQATPKGNPKSKKNWGPAMDACTPFQRRFVEFMYNHPQMPLVECLRQIGYKGRESASHKMVQRLRSNTLVQAAMLEVGGEVYKSKLPKVLNALDQIIDDRDARDRVKVLHGVLDRSGLGVQKESTTNININFDRDGIIARIAAVLERNQSLLTKVMPDPVPQLALLPAEDPPEASQLPPVIAAEIVTTEGKEDDE